MGKRGPKPKPTALRVLEGNPGRRPINHEEPRPTGDPVCPEHLCADAKAVWKQTMDSLPPGMISAADAPLLAAFCEAASLHKRAVEVIGRERSLILRGRPMPHVMIALEAARTQAPWATRLGLSPADRSGLKLGDRGKGSGKWGGLVA